MLLLVLPVISISLVVVAVVCAPAQGSGEVSRNSNWIEHCSKKTSGFSTCVRELTLNWS